jgi:cell division protein FtsL
MRMKTVLFAGVPLLWFATLASSVAVIYLRHQAGELTFELSREHARHERLLTAFGQLQLEKSRQTGLPARALAAPAPAITAGGARREP